MLSLWIEAFAGNKAIFVQRNRKSRVSLELTPDQMRMAICAEIGARWSSQKAFAHGVGVSAGYINDVVHGRREPSGKLLQFMRFERVTIYRASVTVSEQRSITGD